ncbi:MAG: transketolase family protein [Christensenellaceae bacterium]|nr:transketolase family protein [Christensenellaceae bacterium]
MKTEAVRMAFTAALLEAAKNDETIFAVTTDSRGSVTLGDFAKQLPQQFVEIGIAEQNAIGVSAGLANAGLRPFVCGPASFYSLRSAEQIKVDVAYSNMNVKIMAVSGGVSYGALGTSHHATQDIALMRAIPGIEVYLPADGAQMRAMLKYFVKSNKPAYVRMGRGAVPEVYKDEAPFVSGKANCLREGKDIALIACGEMVYHCLQAAELLVEQGVEASVIDMHTLSPIDKDAIIKAAKTGLVITVEEHCIHGGLGSAVASILAEECPTAMCILGLPDEDIYNGASADVFEYYGLNGSGIAKKVLEVLKK